ncbi:sigma factor-like helix-turn-helix DNA-binding protein [Streptomyces virginiae]
MDATYGFTPPDWIVGAWQLLDERSRSMLTLRDDGLTLETIGKTHGITRERARQLIQSGESHLSDSADMAQPGWREAVLELVANTPAVSDTDLGEIIQDPAGVARRTLLRHVGLEEPKTWAGRLRGAWTDSPAALERLLSELLAQAPFHAYELRERAGALGIPHFVPIEDIAAAPRSPVTRGHQGGWIRRSAKHRDAAYLWLTEVGEPLRAESISMEIQSGGARALSEALRRDDRFRQIRPEGTWSLSDWPALQSAGHTNALDAMVAVLRRNGALGKRELFARVAKEYPVSYARLQQCLISDRIGLTIDGSIDLVENNARPMEEREPKKPDSIAANDSLMGIRLTVDKNMMRGSGIIVHPWLTWRMGLRLAPTSRVFSLKSGAGDLVARRMTSGAQISSLRPHILSAGMHVGCALIVLFNLNTESAEIQHRCTSRPCLPETSI